MANATLAAVCVTIITVVVFLLLTVSQQYPPPVRPPSAQQYTPDKALVPASIPQVSPQPNVSLSAKPQMPPPSPLPPPPALKPWHVKPHLKTQSNAKSMGAHAVGTECPANALTDGDVHLHLPRHFSSNMVIQRGAPHCFRGWVDKPNVCVVLTRVAMRGRGRMQLAATSKPLSQFNFERNRGTKPMWQICLPPEQDTGPFEFRISAGTDSAILQNVVYGDVWVCAGLPLALPQQPRKVMPPDAAPDLLRFLMVQDNLASEPPLDITPVPLSTDAPEDVWQPLGPHSAKLLSPMCISFAQQLFSELQPDKRPAAYTVPIGIIQACTIQGQYNLLTFLPMSVIQFARRHCHLAITQEEERVTPPTALYNSMFTPLLEFTIAGMFFATRRDGVPARGVCLLDTLARAFAHYWTQYHNPMLVLVAGILEPDVELPFGKHSFSLLPILDIKDDAEKIGSRAAKAIHSTSYRPNATVEYHRGPRMNVLEPHIVALRIGPRRYQLKVQFEDVTLQPQPGCRECCDKAPLDVLLDSSWTAAKFLESSVIGSTFIVYTPEKPDKVRYSLAQAAQCLILHPVSHWPLNLFALQTSK